MKRPPYGQQPLARYRYKNIIHRPRYWHPYHVYAPGATTTVWRDLGYPYYVGGTDYVMMQPSEENAEEQSSELESVPSTVDSQPASETDIKYFQLLELSDLIHQWRSMNESPELHKRIPGPQSSQESRDTFAEIKEENRKCDQATRLAMSMLAQGQSAEPQLEAAGQHFQKLIELVELLPEPTKK